MVTKTVTMDFEDDVEDLWCEDCQHNHGLDCPKLGPAIRVEDRKVQTKAVATLPDNLSIQMIGGSRRVIASEPIARRTQFGPLEAKIIHEEPVHVAVKYKIFGQQIVQHCLDLTNENDCNWMSLVTMSSDPKQQNLVSFQHQAQIFFLAMRDIQAGETLFAWYSPKYEAKLLQDAKKGCSSQSDTRRRNVEEAVQGNENLSPSQILSPKVKSKKSVLSSSDENRDVDIKDMSGNSPICSIESLAAKDDLSDEGGSDQEETADVVSEDNSEDFRVRDAPVEASQIASRNRPRSHHTNKEQNVVGNSDQANCENGENRDSKILTKMNIESGSRKNVSDKQERGSEKSNVAYSCPFCPGKYPTTENLTNHMNTEHRNRLVNRYKCCKCAKNFEDFIRLQTHELGHESLLTSVCHVCGVRVLKTVADSHLQKRHPQSTEYLCLDCQEKFVTLQKFALHVRDHKEKELVDIQQMREDLCLEKVSSKKKKNKKEKKGRINSKKSKEVVKSVNNHKFEERCVFTDGEKTPTSSSSCISAASSSCCNVSLNSKDQSASETKKSLQEKRTKLHTERRERRGKRNDEKTLAEDRSSDLTIQMGAKVHDTRQSRKRGRLKMCSLSGREDGNDLQPTQEEAEESGRMENHDSLSDDIEGSDSPAGHRTRIQSEGIDKDSECPNSCKRRKIKRKVEKETDGPLSFYCPLCDKVFHSLAGLTNHNVKHKQRKHRCQHCNYSCITMSTLDEHILNTHKDVTLGIPEQFKYSCETEGCDKVFLSLGRLTKHLQYHLPVGQRRQRTSLEQDRDDTVRMEMIRGQASPLKDQSQASIHCPVCKREFDEVKVRNVHLCTHFRSIPCEGNKDVLVEVPSRGAKALTCTKCNQEYSSTNYLVRHYQQHHRIKVQLCCFCFDPMESNARLKQHMMDHISHDKTTPVDPNVSGMLANFHTCELCFAIFPNKSTLQRHTTSHIKAKDFICEICGKAFGRKDTLEDHVERHVQDKTFQCQICGKYLKTARSLVLHLATHTNERNFQCKFCLRGFKQMGNLNKHLLICGLKESARTFKSVKQRQAFIV